MFFCKFLQLSSPIAEYLHKTTMKEPMKRLNLYARTELTKEAHVILEVMTEVVDLPLQHRDTLNSHSESEAGIFLAVNAGSLEHVRIHHTAAENLEPACSFTDVASLSMTDVAAYIHLS